VEIGDRGEPALPLKLIYKEKVKPQETGFLVLGQPEN
jgi:hypothetical protein